MATCSSLHRVVTVLGFDWTPIKDIKMYLVCFGESAHKSETVSVKEFDIHSNGKGESSQAATIAYDPIIIVPSLDSNLSSSFFSH